MDKIPIVEPGAQFFARVTNRPLITDLDMKIFPNGLTNKETIEICGNISSGKSILLSQYIAKTILLKNYNDKKIEGLDVGVLLINNDHHIKLTKIISIMKTIINKNNILLDDEIDDIIKQSLLNIKIISCYDCKQFWFTTEGLDTKLLNNKKIGLVVVDSISAFYWQDRQHGGPWIIDDYIKTYMKTIQRHTYHSKIPLIYVKPTDIMSTLKETIVLSDESTIGKINKRIKLQRYDKQNTFKCFIETSNSTAEIDYTIDTNGINWI